MVKVIEFNYNELGKITTNNLEKIEAGFGSEALGIVVIRNVPGYVEARKELLPLIRDFALLDDDLKRKYEKPDINYQFGWSHGKEVLENGNLDTAKGSYYANPIDQRESDDVNLSAKNNVWPDQEIPQFQKSFKKVSDIMYGTALKLAQLCDAYVVSKGAVNPNSIENTIRSSAGAKGRLLYYFPQTEQQNPKDGKWCGWHCDHGSITCLTKAMYFDSEGKEITYSLGDDLAIESRKDSIQKVVIPNDCIAFQIGQAAQIDSGCILKATPHCVSYPNKTNVARCTFALFLQPDPSAKLVVPEIKPPLPSQYQTGMTFGQFTAKTVENTYKQAKL